MSQTFHVVQCFRCDCFQVHQVKKVKKWTCKLCGVMQSLLKEFGRGGAADCRRHVQKLNATRGAMLEEPHVRSLRKQPEEERRSEGQQEVSRWSKYVAAPEDDDDDQDVLSKDMQCFRDNILTDREKQREDAPQARSTATPGPPSDANTRNAKRLLPFASAPASSLGCDTAAGLNGAVAWRAKALLPASSRFDSGDDFDVSF
ncbi:MRN complex-interacting protein isoform 2-T2 [Syngnathus typhle]